MIFIVFSFALFPIFCTVFYYFNLSITVAVQRKFALQIDVDIGSSSVARSIIGLVLGYVTSIVVDLAILIEVLLGPYYFTSRN